MPDPLYTRLLATANRLINQYGKPAVVRRDTRSGDEWDPVITTTDYDVVYVETGYKLTDRDGTNIRENDVIGLIAMDGDIGVINKDDVLIVDGKNYEFVDVKPLNPGGLQLLTEFQAR